MASQLLVHSFPHGFTKNINLKKRSGFIVALKFGHKSLTSSNPIVRVHRQHLQLFNSKSFINTRLFCSSPNNDEKSADNSPFQVNMFFINEYHFFWGLKELGRPISGRWNVPWDWKITLFTMTACGMSFVLTGLAESTALSYLGINSRQFTSLDEKAIIVFADQFLITGIGLAVIYALVNRYKPLPEDLFRYDIKAPFNLTNGWFLWSIAGTFAAVVCVALAGTASAALNGGNQPREVDSLALLLPLIGSSNISTACLLGVTGVLAPLYEETVFRGYLMTSLSKWFPTPIAVLISAAAFALAHLTPGEFPQLFVLGTVLGFSYAQTRNLLTPITVHAFWNSGVIVLLTFLKLQGYDIKEIIQ